MMDILNKRAKQPRLRDKHELQGRVMLQIAELEKRRIRRHQRWLNGAAAVLLLLSLGAYAWLELDTYTRRMNTFANLDGITEPQIAPSSCAHYVEKLLGVLEERGFMIDQDKQSVWFSKQDVGQLAEADFLVLPDVNKLLASLEIIYPLKYHKYMAGEVIVLNARQLKRDERLCAWLK